MATSVKKKKAASKGTEVDQVDFRKANESIGLLVVSGKFSLVQRRLYNVFVSHAQRQGAPGLNAPINTPGSKDYFWIPLSEVMKDASYTSNNYESIKEQAERLGDILLRSETAQQFTSERLISGVKIVNTEGLNSKQGIVWIGFAFPPEIMQMVLAPNTYTRFSLYYQGLLRSVASLALYEICRRYATSPSHLTTKSSWEWWCRAITGIPVNEPVPEFKYFNRDTLTKSIAEINKLTDIDIEPIVSRVGRRVDSLQFRVQLKQQSQLELPPAPMIDETLLKRIMAFGITEKSALNLYLSYDEAAIRAEVEFTEARLKKSPPVASPAGYFRQALKEGYSKGKPVKVVETPVVAPEPKQAKRSPIRERFKAARNEEAFRLYEQLEPKEQEKHVADFIKKTDATIRKLISKNGLHGKAARTAFSEWFANEMWGEPTDSDILAFVEAEKV